MSFQNNFGSLFFRFDKPFYSPGGQVNGLIQLNASIPLVGASQLVVHAKGVARVKALQLQHYTENNAQGHPVNKTRHVPHQAEKVEFEMTIPVQSFPGTVPPGNYQYPFSFPLPAGLPASTSWQQGEEYIHVDYVLEAILKTAIPNSQLFTVQQQLIVANQQTEASVGQQRKEKSYVIGGCCCSKYGQVNLIVYFEKNDYLVGETATLIFEADNSKGEAQAGTIQAVFRQYVKINTPGYTDNNQKDIHWESLPGPEPGQGFMGQAGAKRVQLRLVDKSGSNLPASARSSLFSIEYALIGRILQTACCSCSGTEGDLELPLIIRKMETNPMMSPTMTPGVSPGGVPVNYVPQMQGQIPPGFAGGQNPQGFSGGQVPPAGQLPPGFSPAGPVNNTSYPVPPQGGMPPQQAKF